MEQKRRKHVRTKRTPRVVKHTHKFGFIGEVFCPLEHNNHSPHMLRGVTLIAISVMAIFFMGVSFARYYFLHGTALGQEIVSSVLIDLANETRLKYGETPLVRNQLLEEASRLKAEDMATYQYFAHNSPTGVTPWYWMKKAGYDFLYAGENLAVDFTQSQDVNDAWLKSPTHRANILNSKFKEIGISVKEGMIDGHNTIYVVQMFGTPKTKIIAPDLIVEANTPTTTPSSATITPAITGEVAGAQIEEPPQPPTADPVTINLAQNNLPTNTEEAPKVENYITLMEGDNTLIVADREVLTSGQTEEEIAKEFTSQKPVQYSNFWQKLIYNFWSNLNLVYKIIVAFISISMIILFFVEFRRQHWLHMLYGLLTILLLLGLLYINQHLW